MTPLSLMIHEIFYSLQGESTFMGRPCTFVRLAGCNLHCAYCDTPATQVPGPGDTRLLLEDIIARVDELGCPLVEITGGEPLHQDATPELCRRLLAAGYRVLLETNGTHPLTAIPTGTTVIMDVKTPSSGMAGRLLVANLKRLAPPDQVKFVIGDPADADWACDFLAGHSIPEGVEILFSPVQPGMEAADLARLILDRHLNVRLQVQLHKWLHLP